MSWFTTLDDSRKIVRSSSTIIERRIKFGGEWTAADGIPMSEQERTVTEYTYAWPGIDATTVNPSPPPALIIDALVATLASDADCIDAHYEAGEGGSATVVQTIKTYTAWEDV